MVRRMAMEEMSVVVEWRGQSRRPVLEAGFTFSHVNENVFFYFFFSLIRLFYGVFLVIQKSCQCRFICILDVQAIHRVTWELVPF